MEVRWRRAYRVLRGVLCGIGAAYVVVTVTPLVRWLSLWAAEPWNDARAPVVIVLGSEVQTDGILGESSYWRAVYAVRVWREGGVEEIVVSGGGGIAQSIREFLVGEGVPAGSVVVEGASRSTRENALFTARLLRADGRKKVLLVSDYHAFRAGRAFRKAGMDVGVRAFPDAAKRASRWQERWGIFLDLVLETAKVGYYAGRGWI
jgi:uncharacterized SAM-binding protein YcdF (DUF218 family)